MTDSAGSYVEQVLRLREEGMSPAQIHHQLGGISTPAHVMYVIGKFAPSKMPDMHVEVMLPNAVYMKFVGASQRRKEKLNDFILKLLIASSECIDAIRDD